MTQVQTIEGSVPVQYRGFWIGDFDFELDDPTISMNLVTQNGPAIWITAGCESGSVNVSLELHTDEPPTDGGFEEVENAELTSESGDVWVHQADPAWGAEELRLTVAPGRYEARVAANGRSRSEPISEDVEHYRIQIWPA